MSIRPVVLLLAAGLLLATGLAVAWQKWPPLLRYQERRAIAAGRRTVQDYLYGRDSLEAAARRLATIMTRWNELILKIGDAPPAAGSMVVETLGFTPPDAMNDPRVEELYLNAMKLSVPHESSPEFKARAAAHLDSILIARGHRIVR
jgi:hypothetical protein